MLGWALSERFGSSSLDADDYYWMLTDSLYKEKCDLVVWCQLILDDHWRVSSALVGGCVRNWGGELEGLFSLIVFLTLDAEICVAKLQEREMGRVGPVHEEFLEGVVEYDIG